VQDSSGPANSFGVVRTCGQARISRPPVAPVETPGQDPGPLARPGSRPFSPGFGRHGVRGLHVEALPLETGPSLQTPTSADGGALAPRPTAFGCARGNWSWSGAKNASERIRNTALHPEPAFGRPFPPRRVEPRSCPETADSWGRRSFSAWPIGCSKPRPAWFVGALARSALSRLSHESYVAAPRNMPTHYLDQARKIWVTCGNDLARNSG
jgi:hypothetical protein